MTESIPDKQTASASHLASSLLLVHALLNLVHGKPTAFIRQKSNLDPQQLEITLNRIHELTEEEEEDEYGEFVRPSEYATQTAIELVSKAANTISGEFFKA